METRRFGRTGHMSTIVVFGSFAVGQVSQAKADEAMALLMAYGVNHIDVAPSYHDAEVRIGPWLERYRDHFFLGCKTQLRMRNQAREEMLRSLERLRIERFDLFQLHAVTTMAELDRCFAADGSLAAILEAREQGLTDYVGITSHGLHAPAVQIEALKRYDFDSLLLPLNFILWAREDYRRDMTELLEMAVDRDVGVMVIKTFARGPWGDKERRYQTWYEPFDEPELIEKSMSFNLSLPISSIVSAGDACLLPLILKAAEGVRAMDEAGRSDLLARAADYQIIFD